MSLKEQVKDQIDAARGDATYLELYRKTGIDPGYAHRLTSKPQNLTLATLEKIATALDCDVEVKITPKDTAKNN